ncbi:MAG TPA: response regulator [Verrucomicrobiae bacterium]|jgi:CheY-like chemotaxis protein|nr:response regulator [Verrucomicrobiae bacterium]
MSSTPTVYFIDDSATMREVIKIAFRRENINVVACQDATAALLEIEQARPAVVITDVIMPGKDGYEVCQFIKGHPTLSKTPVVLMSGVVNRAVAERAFAVKADELLRKPFQPQDLIARVKHLLKPNGEAVPQPAASVNAAAALSNIFASAAVVPPRTASVAAVRPLPVMAAAGPALVPAPAAVPVVMPASKPAGSTDGAKLKIEVLRLEGLVKKLQSELLAEREYSHALEAHVKTLQEAD